MPARGREYVLAVADGMLTLAAANPAVTHGKAGLIIDHLASFAATGNVHLMRAANCEITRISAACQGIVDNGDFTADVTPPPRYPYPAQRRHSVAPRVVTQPAPNTGLPSVGVVAMAALIDRSDSRTLTHRHRSHPVAARPGRFT